MSKIWFYFLKEVTQWEKIKNEKGWKWEIFWVHKIILEISNGYF